MTRVRRSPSLALCALLGAGGSAAQTPSPAYDLHGTVHALEVDYAPERFEELAAVESEEEFGRILEGMARRQPAANVMVRLHGETVERETVTDSEGAFRFADVPPGGYRVSAEASMAPPAGEGSQRAVTAEKTVEIARSDLGLDLELHPDRITVSGRIADTDGHPIAGAKVIGIQEIVDPSNMHDPNIVTTVSDADGVYELSGLSPLHVWRMAGLLNGGDPTWDGHSLYLVVRVAADGYRQRADNVPRFPLVTEELLQAARRLLHAVKRLQTRLEGSSDIVEKENLPALPFSRGNLIPDIDIALEPWPNGRVSGRVLDTNGDPAAGRTLELGRIRGDEPPLPGEEYLRSWPPSPDTDENGAFEIPSIVPGTYSVVVYRPSPIGGDRNMEQVPIEGGRFEVAPGESVENLDMRVHAPGDFTVSGRVRDARGNPVCGLVVGIGIPHGRSWWTRTDDQGAYRLDGLDGIGLSSFTVNFGNGQPSLRNVPLNAEDADLVMPGTGEIRGTVIDAGTMDPVAAYEVEVAEVRLPECDAVWEKPYVPIEQDDNGGFLASDVPEGEATLVIRADGLGAQRFVTPVEAGKINPVECSMLGPAVLEGRTTLDGKPKSTTIIVNGEWLGSDDDGRFRFDQFPDGNHTIHFRDLRDSQTFRSAEVRLVSGEATRLDMELGGSCEVNGSLRFPGNEGPCVVRLAGRIAHDGWRSYGDPEPEDQVVALDFVRQSGDSYRLRFVPPGRWHLMVGTPRPSMHRDVLLTSRVIELSEGQTLTLDLDLTSGTE